MLTAEELQAIRKRMEAASPAPWKTWGMAVMYDPIGDSDIKTAIKVADCQSPPECRRRFHTGNTTFIAHARQDIPALLAHIDATEGEGSPRCQAVQALCRAIVAARGEIKDGTILDMAESLLRRQREQLDAQPPRWLPAPPIVPPETETWVWMEHRVAPVRVRACREGVADVLWWDDGEGDVEDLPYQKAVGWRLWVGTGEGRRWAGRGGRPE